MTTTAPLPQGLDEPDWPEVGRALMDATLATDRFRAAFEAIDADLADLLRARIAYASATRVVFGTTPVPHADLYARLFGLSVDGGDRTQHRGPLDLAEAVHAALEAPRPAVKVERCDLPAFAALAAAFQATGAPLPSLAALPILAAHGLLPAVPPPVGWAIPSTSAPARARQRAALENQTRAFEQATDLVGSAANFTTNARHALRAAGLRSTNATFVLVDHLAGLPVVTAATSSGSGAGVSSSAFTTAMPRLVALGLAREVTGRRKARAWVAADPDLTPAFRLPRAKAVPPKADRLADQAAIDLDGHDRQAAEQIGALDALLGEDGRPDGP